jgi:ABC-type branched-subunit amino acid transport system substrate-binding protein
VRARPGVRLGALLAAALTLTLPLVACGSRLPESDFTDRPTQAATTAAAPIRVGIITSATSPVGGGAFSAPRDGALAYIDALNARGGVAGHRLEAVTCDDGGSGVGNNECVRKLVDQAKVFALVATSSLDYAGAPYVSRKGVPDIGGIPIGTEYDTYPHLYGIYGSRAPRDGTPGWGGTLYAGTEVYRFFKERLKARTAAVVYYNQSASARYADQILRGLKAEGYRTISEEVDFALPNFRAVAADLRARHVDILFDAMDTHGNGQLCRAMQSAGVTVTAKVTNVQNWASTVPADYKDAAGCRNALWATSASRNYDDTSDAAVRAFRTAMAARKPGYLAQWQLEGWAAAMWLSDAIRACATPGTNPSRACVERFVTGKPYDAGGLLIPVGFTPTARPPATARTCLSVAQWSDRAGGDSHGGWVTRGGDMRDNCFEVPQLPYRS